MIYLLFLIAIIVSDYFALNYLELFELKTFVVLHGSLLIVGGIIWSMIYLFRNKKDYMGLIITAGLLIKMGVMFSIFVVLYNKVGMTQGQILNFLIVYSLYTLTYTLYFVKKLNYK